jgi:gluconate 2-dehydrogenase subunit 3-like protein
MPGPEHALRELVGAPMDRRRFLKGSATGLALLGLGAVLPAGCSRYPKPKVPLKFFNPREYATMNAAAERILGASGVVGVRPEQIDVAAHIDGLLADWDAEAQGQLRTMLRVFEHGTYLFDLRRQRFTRLTDEYQDRYLDGWMNSTMGARRIVFRALKALADLGFYQDPRTWAPVGYEGPWIGRVEAAGRAEPEPVSALSVLRPGGA